MRSLLLVLLSALIGAAGFHIYYRGLSAEARCGWDHPFDDRAKDACAATGVPNYTAKDRAKLDALIDEVR